MLNPRKGRRTRARLTLVVLAGVSALLATTLATSAQAAAPQGSSGQGSSSTTPSAATGHEFRSTTSTGSAASRRARALAALARAQRALSPSTPANERPDATLALRTLWEFKSDLPRPQRRLAAALGARPNKPMEVGDSHFLIHYDPAQLTTYTIQDAMATMSYVTDTYAAAGYRRPPSDGTKGGDGRLDVYLDELPPGLYGYCISDQPRAKKPGHYNAYSYCVLDPNYDGFPPVHTPLQNLQVTAAHEYFHAVQFGYDVLEDKWMLEATATWAEDELYPDINDNLQYLSNSPISNPKRSIDSGSTQTNGFYGVWSFFRYLTEKYPTKTGPLPALMLHIWQYADSSKGPRKNLDSVQAINKALRKLDKSTLADQFASYSAANRNTHLFYQEGAALDYPDKPLAGTLALGPGAKKGMKAKLNHLTSATYQLTPSSTQPGTQLKLRFKLGAKAASPRAVVVSYGPGGLTGFDVVKPNKSGVGKTKIDFSSATTSSVEVTLVNASTRYRSCYTRKTVYACGGGVPVDQKKQLVARAKVSG